MAGNWQLATWTERWVGVRGRRSLPFSTLKVWMDLVLFMTGAFLL